MAVGVVPVAMINRQGDQSELIRGVNGRLGKNFACASEFASRKNSHMSRKALSQGSSSWFRTLPKGSGDQVPFLVYAVAGVFESGRGSSALFFFGKPHRQNPLSRSNLTQALDLLRFSRKSLSLFPADRRMDG